VGNDGATNVPGLRIAGDLTGIPLLKFAADSGVKAVRAFAAELATAKAAPGPDLAIIGGGVSGIAAAIEARRIGILFVVFEASQPFFTIANFPKKKPIYTYPADFKPAGELQMQAIVKRGLTGGIGSPAASGWHRVHPRAGRVDANGVAVLDLLPASRLQIQASLSLQDPQIPQR